MVMKHYYLLRHHLEEQYESYENIFGFLFNSDKLLSMDDEKLLSCCFNFESALKKGEGEDLFVGFRMFLPN